MLRPRLGTPWVGFLRNWRMLWIAQTDSKDSQDTRDSSVYYTHIYLTILHSHSHSHGQYCVAFVWQQLGDWDLDFGLGFWDSDSDLSLAFFRLHALFFIHASLARGYQQTRWYIVRIQAWVCMSGQLGHKVSTVAATLATVLRATCKTFCISSQRYFIFFLWPGSNNFSLEFIWCCWVMQRLRQHLNYGDDNAFADVCDMSAIPCRSCSCGCWNLHL